MLNDLQLRFTDNEISPWGGPALLFKLPEQRDMKEALSECSLPQQGSNRGYTSAQLIYGLLAVVWCGASCFEQLGIGLHDVCLRKIPGWNRGASHKAYMRYFDKFSQL